MLSSHLFSTEELTRNKGTMIVDQNVQALGIITTDGQYTQITEQSGLYSFDPAVIEALADSGYTWNRYYTGIRHVNLRDTALFNDVQMRDKLVLSDSMQIITNNMITDQLFGKYQVSFSLSDCFPDKEENAVMLEIIGENGDRTILQEKLTAKNFNSEGRCEHTMTYTINPTPSVYFGISTMEGTDKYVISNLNATNFLRIRMPTVDGGLHNKSAFLLAQRQCVVFRKQLKIVRIEITGYILDNGSGPLYVGEENVVHAFVFIGTPEEHIAVVRENRDKSVCPVNRLHMHGLCILTDGKTTRCCGLYSASCHLTTISCSYGWTKIGQTL